MKKVLSLLMIVLVFCFVGCVNEENTDNKSIIENTDDKNISIWTDAETGVQYIVYTYKAGYGGMGGITPRLNSDGTLYIEGE